MHRRGFSLIELLVVIAVIGLLATFAVVQMGGSRDKARVAKGLAFSRTLLSNADAEIAGMWAFDECSGTVASDVSGLNNAATLSGTIAWSTETPSGKDCSIDASVGGNVTAPDNGSLDITDNLTVSLWMHPVTESAAVQVIPLQKFTSTALANFRLYFYGTGSATSRRLLFYATRGGAWGAISGSTYLEIGKWTHVALVYKSNSGGQLYIDGSPVGSPTPATGGLLTTNDAAVIAGGNFPGYLDDIRILKQAFSAQEIQRLYAEGAQTKNSVAKK